MAGEREESAEAARRRERRAAARAHHPDLGGDAATLQAALAAVEARYSAPSRGPSTPRVDRGAHRDVGREDTGREDTGGIRARLRGGVRLVRERIPAGWPGHRRLIDLPPRRTDGG